MSHGEVNKPKMTALEWEKTANVSVAVFFQHMTKCCRRKDKLKLLVRNAIVSNSISCPDGLKRLGCGGSLGERASMSINGEQVVSANIVIKSTNPTDLTAAKNVVVQASSVTLRVSGAIKKRKNTSQYTRLKKKDNHKAGQ